MNRRLALLALGAALVAAPAPNLFGQQPAPAPPSQPPAQQPAQQPPAEAEEGAPLSKLGLSEDQKKQIHSIRKQSQEQVQAVRKDTSLTPQQQMQQIRKIRRNELQQVEGVLTPEQREKYEAWRRTHRRRRQPQPQQQPQQQPAKPDGA